MNTKAERILRKHVWAQGFRYRLHLRDVPGKPDLAFSREKVAVFCDGDFWHGRDWRQRRTKLSKGSNAAYWVAKIASNRRRDQETNRRLTSARWIVLRLWETDILADPGTAAARVASLVLQRRDAT